MIARTDIVHEPLEVNLRAGDELPDDHPFVALRPDLFTASPTEPPPADDPKED